MEKARFTKNKELGVHSEYTEKLSYDKALQTRKFHEQLPGYNPTALVSLDSLADKLGVQKIWIKDESTRFGLNAFKSLGGSYGVCSSLAKLLGKELDTLTFAQLKDLVRQNLQGMHIVTATDGNHGRGIAWISGLLGLPVDIYMPKGTTQARIKAIENLGGTVHVTDVYFDDTARMASQAAEENN